MDLGAIQTDRPQFEQPHLLGVFKDLNKQRFEFAQKATAEGGQRVVIRVTARRNEAKGHGVVRRPFQLAAGKDARRVSINQDRQQRRWMVSL